MSSFLSGLLPSVHNVTPPAGDNSAPAPTTEGPNATSTLKANSGKLSSRAGVFKPNIVAFGEGREKDSMDLGIYPVRGPHLKFHFKEPGAATTIIPPKMLPNSTDLNIGDGGELSLLATSNTTTSLPTSTTTEQPPVPAASTFATNCGMVWVFVAVLVALITLY